MPPFSERHSGYKAGMVLVLPSVVMATWGVITPGWLRQNDLNGDGVMYHDLWFVNCRLDFTHCQPAQFTIEDAAMLATLGLCCVGLLALLCACLMLVRANFCVSLLSYGLAAEVLVLLAALSLFIGCMTYVGDNADFLQNFPGTTYGPSFILTLISSVLSGLGGILLSIFNKRPGSSYHHNSRFRRPVPIIAATMMDAAAPVSTVATIQTASSIQHKLQGYPPVGHFQGRGYGYYLHRHERVRYGTEHVLYSSYQAPHPCFR